MSRPWQIYYNATFGALGALIAWQILGWLDTHTWDIHLANLTVGGGIGLMVGAALGVVEGLLVKRSLGRAFLGTLVGGVVGCLSGMFGLWLGGWLFLKIQGGLVARSVGWLLFGAFLGAGQGLAALNSRRLAYGLLGGALGGLGGGLGYEIFTHLFLEQSEQAQVVLGAMGLSLVGGALGAFIPLSVSVISGLRAERGLVRYLSGPRQGTEIEVVGFATLGSSDACDIYTPDPQVEKRQAEIRLGEQGFEVCNVGQAQYFLVNQSPLWPGQSVPLPNGAQLQFGEIALQFQAMAG